MKIQVVTSALNEEDCIKEYCQQMRNLFELHNNYEWELLFFDNGSKDKTWELIKSEAKSDSRFTALRMSRTFDLDNAFSAGLDLADADAVILMASDLQDPPLIISKFIEKWELGAKHVVAKVNNRKNLRLTMKIGTKTFYWLSHKLTDGLIPQNVSDFRLLDKKVYTVVKSMREQHRWLRATIAWTGFQPDVINFDRPERFAGRSNVTIKKIFPVALRALLAFSAKPVIWLFNFALFAIVCSILLTISLAIFWVSRGVPFSGFGWIILVMIIGFSFNFSMIALLAQYVSLNYNESKNRPLYILSEVVKLEKIN